MPRIQDEQEVLAGKLILAIQKVWNEQAGGPEGQRSENVMHAGHTLLQAAKHGTLTELLAGRHVAEYLGQDWFQCNQSALLAADALQEAMRGPGMSDRADR